MLRRNKRAKIDRAKGRLQLLTGGDDSIRKYYEVEVDVIPRIQMIERGLVNAEILEDTHDVNVLSDMRKLVSVRHVQGNQDDILESCKTFTKPMQWAGKLPGLVPGGRGENGDVLQVRLEFQNGMFTLYGQTGVSLAGPADDVAGVLEMYRQKGMQVARTFGQEHDMFAGVRDLTFFANECFGLDAAVDCTGSLVTGLAKARFDIGTHVEVHDVTNKSWQPGKIIGRVLKVEYIVECPDDLDSTFHDVPEIDLRHAGHNTGNSSKLRKHYDVLFGKLSSQCRSIDVTDDVVKVKMAHEDTTGVDLRAMQRTLQKQFQHLSIIFSQSDMEFTIQMIDKD